MQWMVPHNRLGEMQLHVLDSCLKKQNGHNWIRGFAGSGKTVLLVHAIVESLTKNPNMTVCVVVYTHALKDLVSTGIPDHLGSNIPVMTYHHFRNNPRHYDLIVVDEIQDLEASVLRLLMEYSKRLIVAGDENQSIYKQRVSTHDIEQILSPEKHKLEVLYRLTQALRDIVRTILPNSLIEGARISRMADVQVTLAHASGVISEIQWVWQQAKRFARQGDPAAVLLPKRRDMRSFIDHVCTEEGIAHPAYEKDERGKIDYDIVNAYLRKNDVALRYIGSSYGSLAESDERPIVYLMTYHSAKGLDYETVFLPHLDEGVRFWRDDSALERRLFFVATTRSRRNLFMSYHTSQAHAFVRGMPKDLLHKIDCTVRNQAEDEDNLFF